MKRWFAVMLFVFVIGWVPAMAQGDTQQALDAIIRDFADPDSPAIVVQITTPDGSWAAAGGSADGTRPAAATDRFRIASMSKTFVSAAALMLAEDGVFALDDLAAEYLPSEVVAQIANADQATIRHLLGMRSGIPDYLETEGFWAQVQSDLQYEWTPLEALTYAYDIPAHFAPGEDFYYSNSNYLLMQLVIEAATDQPLHEVIRQRILAPLSLNDTYTQISESLPGGFVEGYEDIDFDGIDDPVSTLNDGAGMGDGALISNAADLTAFYAALLRDRTLLSGASMQELLNFSADDEGELYSLGLAAFESPYGTAWGHSGGVVGYLSMGVYLPEIDTIVIALSASSDVTPDQLVFAALEAVSP